MTLLAPHRLFFVLAVLTALAFGVLANIADEGHIFGVDFTIQAVVQNARHPSLERFMQKLTDLGSGWFLVPLNLLLYLLLRLSDRRLAVAVLAVSLGSVPVEGLAKWAVARPRPKLTPYGFPSGHVFVSVAFFGMLIYVIWILEKRPAWRWIATSVCVVLASGIAFSRLYLNAHWFTDVLGGFLGGSAYLLSVLAFADGYLRPRRSLSSRTS